MQRERMPPMSYRLAYRKSPRKAALPCVPVHIREQSPASPQTKKPPRKTGFSRRFPAERQGFEPWMPLLTCRFSRPVQSAALPPLRGLLHWTILTGMRFAPALAGVGERHSRTVVFDTLCRSLMSFCAWSTRRDGSFGRLVRIRSKRTFGRAFRSCKTWRPPVAGPAGTGDTPD